MKNKKVLKLLFMEAAVLAIALVLGMMVVGCGNGDGNGELEDGDAKTLVITNFYENSIYFPPEGYLGLYPVGTSIESIKNGTLSNIASAYKVSPDVTFSDITFTIPLHSIGHNPPPWTGSGKYDVYMINDFTSKPTKYAFLTIEFSKATKEVDWSEFKTGTFQ